MKTRDLRTFKTFKTFRTMKPDNPKTSGFTLIELMVVIVIICLLAAMVFRMMRAVGDADKAAKTKAMMEKVAMALEAYKSLYGKYPPVPTYDSGYSDYREDPIGCNFQSTVHALDEPGQPVEFSFPILQSSGNWKKVPFDSTEAAQITASDKIEPIKWSDTKIFTFGLCSFFVPRYQYMMQNGCPPELLGIPSNGLGIENWSGAHHALQQWTTYNKRRGDSDIGDSSRDVNAARRILPYLSSSIEPDGTVVIVEDIFNTVPPGNNQSMQIVKTGAGTFRFAIFTLRLVDAWWGSDGAQRVVSSHVLRYKSPPPYESYELRSSGPDNVFGNGNDIVIGAK